MSEPPRVEALRPVVWAVLALGEVNHAQAPASLEHGNHHLQGLLPGRDHGQAVGAGHQVGLPQRGQRFRGLAVGLGGEVGHLVSIHRAVGFERLQHVGHYEGDLAGEPVLVDALFRHLQQGRAQVQQEKVRPAVLEVANHVLHVSGRAAPNAHPRFGLAVPGQAVVLQQVPPGKQSFAETVVRVALALVELDRVFFLSERVRRHGRQHFRVLQGTVAELLC
mmetsp:Transcript_70034/g.137692  ORF Transcript_70034/g.137692 Transcript_70034/m.137692 type:complete len:221 (-) Transcript_70034:13-675(-)